MSAYSKYKKRFLQACEKRGLITGQGSKSSTIDQLLYAIQDRAKNDGQLDAVFHTLTPLLEIRNCEVGHCQHHTAFAYSSCRDLREPGKCEIARAYRKRLKVRAIKEFNWLINELACKDIIKDEKEFLKRFNTPNSPSELTDRLNMFKVDIIDERINKWGYRVANQVLEIISEKKNILSKGAKNG
jgi:hypothetical protein